jgi:hypothetical protein
MAGMVRPDYVTEQDTFVAEVRRMCDDSVTKPPFAAVLGRPTKPRQPLMICYH